MVLYKLDNTEPHAACVCDKEVKLQPKNFLESVIQENDSTDVNYWIANMKRKTERNVTG